VSRRKLREVAKEKGGCCGFAFKAVDCYIGLYWVKENHQRIRGNRSSNSEEI
jgi:hypothetical protein